MGCEKFEDVAEYTFIVVKKRHQKKPRIRNTCKVNANLRFINP